MTMYLRLKAWQLFILVLAPMVLVQMLLALGVAPFLTIYLLTPLCAAVVFGWVWSVGIAANRRLPEQLRRSTKMFSGGLAFALIYMTLFGIVAESGGFGALIVPHLLSMFFIFYALWFTARQFVVLQRMEAVTFVDFSGPFFLFWFFPLGVWFLQPRINRLLGDGPRFSAEL